MKQAILLIGMVIGAVSSLSGCGGGDGGSTTGSASSSPVASELTTSDDLVASAEFDFRVDREITVTIQGKSDQPGAYSIYYDYSHYNEEYDRYYPDSTTKIVTINGAATHIPVSINDNWKHLVVEWLPYSGKERELYQLVPINENDSYFIDMR